jgi:hypothetical protein
MSGRAPTAPCAAALQGGGVVEGHSTRAGLGRSLDGQRHQAIVNRHAVHTGTQGAHEERAHPDRLAGRAEVEHIYRAVGTVDNKQPLAACVEGGDFGRPQRSAVVAADLFQGQGDGRAVAFIVVCGTAGQQGRAKHGASQPWSEVDKPGVSGHELRLYDVGRTTAHAGPAP